MLDGGVVWRRVGDRQRAGVDRDDAAYACLGEARRPATWCRAHVDGGGDGGEVCWHAGAARAHLAQLVVGARDGLTRGVAVGGGEVAVEGRRRGKPRRVPALHVDDARDRAVAVRLRRGSTARMQHRDDPLAQHARKRGHPHRHAPVVATKGLG